MLVVFRDSGRLLDASFRDFPQFLNAGDVLVLNNSRVVAARLFGYRVGLRAQPVGKRNPARARHLRSRIEALLVKQLDEYTWEALVRPGRKVRVGERVAFVRDDAARNSQGPAGEPLEAEVLGRGDYGLRTLRFTRKTSAQLIDSIGHVPLPPYIRRSDEARDRLRYQTVYATRRGSVAAPTAGLHFTNRILQAVEQRGARRVEVTLHVGLGTFQPIHADASDHHQLHSERFEVRQTAAAALNEALQQRRRIVAVGTTTVRTLEHVAAANSGKIVAGAGETRLFIRPGFHFRVTGALLTNFHLPQTSLLLLVAAFAGRDLVLEAYAHAVRERYRFYSYGDCMLIL
jgi:S-adenosylmethionine:tRNA ribosyltransferase-isomerase